jgi:Gamma-glutamyl cyclotransferase, AIG2-like
LGIDTTLPHHRPDSCDGPFLPAQDEYPLWYFFYGTLADSTVLTCHLSLIEEPKLHPASITGGVLGIWRGKYRALVDGPENAKVQGSAFRVVTKEHKVALRHYETDNYAVVRCVIEFEGRTVQGCTLRFVGEIDR